MEEELNQLFNDTVETSFSYYHYYPLHMFLYTSSCVIGFIADVILIAVIVTNKYLQNRTNLILLCFLAIDMLNQIILPTFYMNHITADMFYFKPLSCIFYNADIILQLFEMIAMSVLTLNCVINNTRFSDKTIIYSFVSMLTLFLLVLSILCIFKLVNYMLIISFLIASLSLIIITISKDIYRCCKAKTDPINEEQRFRLNIARIYVYTTFLAGILGEFGHFGHMLLLYSFHFLSSAFIFVYIFNADTRFRICILHLFRRHVDHYRVEKTIGIIQDFEDQEEAKVNITTNSFED